MKKKPLNNSTTKKVKGFKGLRGVLENDLVVNASKGDLGQNNHALVVGLRDSRQSFRLLLKCVNRDMFLVNSTIVDIEELGCTRNPREKEVVVREGEGCGPELTCQISELGLQLGRELSSLANCALTEGLVYSSLSLSQSSHL